MQRFLLILINCGWLALLFIGIPAATHGHLGNYEISRAGTAHLLLYWGLCLGTVGNLIVVLILHKDRKQRLLGLEWAAVFGGLWLLEYAFTRDCVNFVWLRHALEWLQKYL